MNEIILGIIIAIVALGIIGAIAMVLAIRSEDNSFDRELDSGICPLVHKPCRKGAGLNGQPLPCDHCRLFVSFGATDESEYDNLEDYSE
ncbi:MAG: hypothetical protein LUD72_09060 [Bacteroidales bacterium]|nr:hypothetical protein [Bacteroidales bacterium]